MSIYPGHKIVAATMPAAMSVGGKDRAGNSTGSGTFRITGNAATITLSRGTGGLGPLNSHANTGLALAPQNAGAWTWRVQSVWLADVQKFGYAPTATDIPEPAGCAQLGLAMPALLRRRTASQEGCSPTASGNV